jgi:hypothetical protein
MAWNLWFKAYTALCSGAPHDPWLVCKCMAKWHVGAPVACARSDSSHHHSPPFFHFLDPGAPPPYFKVRSGTLMPRWRGGGANGFGFSKLQHVTGFWTISPDEPRPPTRAPCCTTPQGPRAAGSRPHASPKGGHHATAARGLGPLPGPRHNGQWSLEGGGVYIKTDHCQPRSHRCQSSARAPSPVFAGQLRSSAPRAGWQQAPRAFPQVPQTASDPLASSAAPWSRP